jgi:1-aminocyclopropane-1-carboxylate deaminase/D-cysteine desulfhydrase-like pyridoxal-dependent ACC family enzyme
MAASAPPIPRVEVAYAPTPRLKLERLSRELGVELWVKRDDLPGLLETGNKIRKLEFIVGEAMAQRADTLISVFPHRRALGRLMDGAHLVRS